MPRPAKARKVQIMVSFALAALPQVPLSFTIRAAYLPSGEDGWGESENALPLPRKKGGHGQDEKGKGGPRKLLEFDGMCWIALESVSMCLNSLEIVGICWRSLVELDGCCLVLRADADDDTATGQSS